MVALMNSLPRTEGVLFKLIDTAGIRETDDLAVRERILQGLERVGMAHKASRRMGDLSGGERQRVLLAQSLLPPAQFVLLDEPMAALDRAGMQVFESLLAQWRQSRATVLWVEHDLAAVRRLADRVTALTRGRLLWTHTPAALGDAAMLLQLFTHGAASAPEESTPADRPQNDNFRWMMSKVINDNCFVDNFLCKAALNSAKSLEVFPN